MKTMKSITYYKKWDIVLVPFPFTDLTTIKRRPALIISPDEYNTNSDIVIAFVTSNLNVDCRMGDYKIEHWQEADLPKPSMIRIKFATIDKSIVIKRLGRIVENDQQNFQKVLIDFFSQ